MALQPGTHVLRITSAKAFVPAEFADRGFRDPRRLGVMLLSVEQDNDDAHGMTTECPRNARGSGDAVPAPFRGPSVGFVWAFRGPYLMSPFGSFPVTPRNHWMQRWATSGFTNIIGQAPSITAMPCSRQNAAAVGETLPWPNERCIQTWPMPSSAHSRTSVSAAPAAWR